jgi:uncharacterized membrane protein
VHQLEATRSSAVHQSEGLWHDAQVEGALASSPAAVCAALVAIVWITVQLCERTAARHLGAALTVILVGAVASNLNLIPSGSGEESSAVYSAVFAWVAPLSIFWLLLPVNLRSVLSAGTPMLVAFGLGVVGTVLGVVLGMQLIGGASLLGPDYPALAGMYSGTYTGGSVNFNAVALHYGVVESGGLYAAAVVADNIVTALWMVACLGLPRLLAKWWPARGRSVSAGANFAELEESVGEDAPESVTPADLSSVLGLGLAAALLANALAKVCADLGVEVPSILVVTVLGLVAAQFKVLSTLRGARVMAMLSVYAFLAVIGAYCDLQALVRIGELGPRLLVLATTTVAMHGLVSFGVGRLLRLDRDVVSVASQANIGGATTALAVARSLGRSELVLPAILVGSLGNALGTFVGFALAGVLGG